MDANVIGSDIRTVGSKIKWFSNMVIRSIEDGTLSGFECNDAMVITEMIEMANLSRSCNHISTRSKNQYGYERTPTNWSDIPTTVEQMAANFAALTKVTTIMRVNETISTIMCDTMCLIDTAMMYADGYKCGTDILCINITSVRHACMTKLLFVLLHRMVFRDSDVFMHMFVDYRTHPIMARVLNDNRHVIVHQSADWISDINMIKRSNGYRSMVVMMNRPMTPRDTVHLMEIDNIKVSTVAHMSNPMTSYILSVAARTKGMVMEMALLSDPVMNTVRIRDSIWSDASKRHTTMHRCSIDHVPSMISSITYRIRPMSLKRMCFDCRMVQMVVTPIAHAIRNRAMTSTSNETEHWSESYAEVITIDDDDHEAPI